MISLTRAQLILLLLVVMTATALAVGYRQTLVAWVRDTPTEQQPPVGQPAHAAPQRTVLYWYDPMHPAYRSDKPGVAPDCGMTLVPRYADETEAMQGHPPGTVHLSSAKQQLIGVRTAPVEAEPVTQTVRAAGMVEIDETRVARVHTKVSGWVRQVFVDFTWEHVHRGDPLFTLYSPELVSAQQEYLIARRAGASTGTAPYPEVARMSETLLKAARERLKLWDISDDQLAALEARAAPQEEITVYSPASGHVAERSVFPNQYVKPESELYTIVDHSQVWVQAQVFEYELEAVRVGQPASMTVAAFPGRVFHGRVAYINPHLDMTARTANVRLEFPNPELALKPGMYAEVTLATPLGQQIVVPSEAVIDTGTRQLVFLARPDGYFEPREIRVGARLDGRVVVLDGLKRGDTVVTSGAFLIDSESQLTAATGALAHPH